MTLLKKTTLMSDNTNNPFILEGRENLEKAGYSDVAIEYYAERMISVLDDYAAEFGEGTEISYISGKRWGRLESKIFIPGKEYDPFEYGEDAKRRKIEQILDLNLNAQQSCVEHTYVSGRNIISGRVPVAQKRKSILQDPTVYASILGVVAGIICLHLPADANTFIVEEVMDPILSTVLKVMAGIMGPVIFISLVTSIIALDSINDLTNLGRKIFRRFVRCILFFILIAIAVSILFFHNFGEGGIDFSPKQIISMILDIIPLNLFAPFVENNTPQLVVLAFITGIALLLLGDKTHDLNNILFQCNDWIMNTMRIVLKIIPVVPFLSLATAIGKGNATMLIDGWKFIAASYIVYTLTLIFKIAKTTVVTKSSAIDLLRKSKAAILMAFTTGSTAAPIQHIYDASEDIGIRPEFSSFWIPMASAMLALKTAANVVVATFMMTEMTGVPISLTFLFVLIIITFEMSLASPGTISSWVIAFETFSLPTSYVGLFSTYRIFTNNYATGAVIAYNMLEQYEAAYRMDAVSNDI